MATNNQIPVRFTSLCLEGGMNIYLYPDFSGDHGPEFRYIDQ